jgi:hypothetical protein
MSEDPASEDFQALAQQVAAEYVHWLFPNFRMPAFLACPDDTCASAVLAATRGMATAKDVPMEVVDLRPAPAERLKEITARLPGFYGRKEPLEAPAVRILVLNGFDLLEGPGNDAPTYPFRSAFQFDEDHRWLFLGRDWQRLKRLFASYHLPLYQAASDLTPACWREISKAPHRSPNRHI